MLTLLLSPPEILCWKKAMDLKDLDKIKYCLFPENSKTQSPRYPVIPKVAEVDRDTVVDFLLQAAATDSTQLHINHPGDPTRANHIGGNTVILPYR